MSHPPPPPHRAKHQFFGLFTELVSEAQACGEIRDDVDAELVSDLLRTTYFRRMVVCRDDSDDRPRVEEIERILDLLMDGLAGPEWSKR
jgi:hypothetical protein